LLASYFFFHVIRVLHQCIFFRGGGVAIAGTLLALPRLAKALRRRKAEQGFVRRTEGEIVEVIKALAASNIRTLNERLP